MKREVFREMHFKVVKQDEWLTPEYAVRPLLPFLKPESRILCPFDTVHSAYIQVLRGAGHSAAHTHIDSRSPRADFFTYTDEELRSFDYVISNPPYSRKTDVLSKLFASKAKFAVLLGGVGLFEAERFELFKRHSFEIMYFDRRVGFIPGGGQKASGSPPFSSIYVCHWVLPEKIMFCRISRSRNGKDGR
jgi:hypothetical protein